MPTRRSLLTAAVGALALAATAGDEQRQRVVIESQRTGDLMASFSAHEGSTIELSWIHSVEHAVWREFYEVREGGFILDRTEPGSFGAGTPYNAPCTYTVSIDDEVMVESHELPHHTFLSMRVSRRVIET